MVRLLKLIKKTFTASGTSNTFIFPYSSDQDEKRKQIWENLQKGILLEDKQTFIPWGTPYDELNNFKETRKYRADRTEWHLGKRTILDGYESHLEITRWHWKTTEIVTKFDENLGVDEEGQAKFNYLIDYITDLLGEPAQTEIKKFGLLNIGEVRWSNAAVSIHLIGLEHVTCRYSLHISV